MGSLGPEQFVSPVAAKLAGELSAQYASLKINAKRMVDTLEESCTWGNTDDGGMSE